MLKFSSFLLFILLFSACSGTSYNYNFEQKKLLFKNSQNEFLNIKLSNPQVTATSDRCTFFSNTIKDNSKQYGKLFIENVSLQSNCHFNQDSFWAFAYEFNDNLKLKSFEKIEYYSLNNYEFYTFKINNNEFVNFIFIYSPYEFTFFVDYDGKLSNELITFLGGTFNSKYLNDKRFNIEYNHSLVRVNFFKGYFSKSREDFLK